MPEARLPSVAEDLTALVSTLISEIRPQLISAALSGEHADRTNARHTDNFLSDYDLLLHDRYRELLSEIFPSFVYASEEADPQVIGDDPDPDLCVLVDPLDTSEMAVRSSTATHTSWSTRGASHVRSPPWWATSSITFRSTPRLVTRPARITRSCASRAAPLIPSGRGKPCPYRKPSSPTS